MAIEQSRLYVNTSNSTYTFTGGEVYYVEIYNSGSVTAYINFNSAATTDLFPILANETIKVYTAVTSVHAITAATNTELQIFGTR